VSDDPTAPTPGETPQEGPTAGSPSVAVALAAGFVYFIALVLVPFGAAQVLPVDVRISAVASIVRIGLPALVLAAVLLATGNGPSGA